MAPHRRTFAAVVNEARKMKRARTVSISFLKCPTLTACNIRRLIASLVWCVIWHAW